MLFHSDERARPVLEPALERAAQARARVLGHARKLVVASGHGVEHPGRDARILRAARAARAGGRRRRRARSRCRRWFRPGPLGSTAAAGLEAASSGSRSSSVARRSTSVELPCRSVSGSTASPCESESFSAAIAPISPLRFEMREVSCGARCASAPVTLDPATSACSSAFWSRASSCTSWSVVDRNGLRYLADRLTFLALPLVLHRGAVEPLLQALARSRVERVEQLVEVDDGRRLLDARAGRRRGSPARCSAQARARCSGSRRPTAS